MTGDIAHLPSGLVGSLGSIISETDIEIMHDRLTESIRRCQRQGAASGFSW